MNILSYGALGCLGFQTNPNRRLNIGEGTSCNKGTVQHPAEKRNLTFYNRYRDEH